MRAECHAGAGAAIGAPRPSVVKLRARWRIVVSATRRIGQGRPRRSPIAAATRRRTEVEEKLLVGASPAGPQHLLLGMANRHGLIAGATGTGKTVTLQDLAEGFSAAGVPVFAADVKGDLSGLAMPGSA